MERERLTLLLNEPGRVAREDLAGLAALSEKYPWFSGAHLLRTAGEKQTGDVLFDETLKTTSAHLPSRAALFDLVSTPASRPAPLEVVHRPAADVIEVPLPAPKPKTPPAPEPVIELDPVVPPSIAEPIIEAKEEARLDPEPLQEDPAEELDRQIMEAALASAYDLTWSEEVEVPKAPLAEVAKAVAPEPPTEPKRTVGRHSKLRFTDWLEGADTVPSAIPSGIDKEEPTSVGDWLREPSIATAPVITTTTTDRIEVSSLIDRFIVQEQPAPVAKTSFYTPQKAAKKSLDDTAGLVTETLARIYAKQGNTAKAIEAYRKLALKYPEKGAYFAALQKALEEQSNP